MQYLRTDGSRAMTGSLDVGGNDIGNVGNVDGVDVSTHAARHAGGGADAIAAATALVNGLMSSADKSKLDGIDPASYAEIYLSAPAAQGGLGVAPSQVTVFNTNGVSEDSTPDHAGDRVVVGSTGNYKVCFHATFTGSVNVTATFQINVNGTPVANGSAAQKTGTGSWIGQVSVACLLSLNATDAVTVTVSIDTGTSLTFSYTALSIERMR